MFYPWRPCSFFQLIAEDVFQCFVSWKCRRRHASADSAMILHPHPFTCHCLYHHVMWQNHMSYHFWQSEFVQMMVLPLKSKHAKNTFEMFKTPFDGPFVLDLASLKLPRHQPERSHSSNILGYLNLRMDSDLGENMYIYWKKKQMYRKHQPN